MALATVCSLSHKEKDMRLLQFRPAHVGQPNDCGYPFNVGASVLCGAVQERIS
jgi:hypothetical protein